MPPAAPRPPRTALAAPQPGRRRERRPRPAPTCAERARRWFSSLPPPGGGSGRGASMPSRPFFPGRQVVLLLLGQSVDRDPHRLELEPRHLLVDVVGHVVDPLLELAGVGGH